MNIPVSSIKELRNITCAPIADCKKALQDAKGDLKKAQELLRKRGLESAAKKGERKAKEGRIEAYVHHGNKIGVLLEVACETDFVARDDGFAQFAKDVAMQIAAASPLYIRKEDVPDEVLKSESDKEQFYTNHVLLEQVFIKDGTLTIKDYLGSLVAKYNENIVIRRFTRYRLGE